MKDVFCLYIPCPTAAGGQPLCIYQITFSPQQRLLGTLPIGYFPGQFFIYSRQLAGPLYYTLFELLIQTLDFGLGHLVTRSLDNVPAAASLCHRELMCAYYIQDFCGSAGSERVCAQHR